MDDRTTDQRPTYEMWIGGEHVPAGSGQTFPVINPATGQAIADVGKSVV